MPSPTMDKRPFQVISSLEPSDKLLLLRMSGTETLGRLFNYELELLSTDHSIVMSDVLGEHMTVRAQLREGGERFFDGIVSRFSYVGSYGQYARYEATLRPWLWFLTRAADCRIFQGKTTVDIMKSIFGDHGFSDLDLTQITTPEVREYCTQYRESDFNFLSRLMEHDGLYYYFKHEHKKHTLVLADGASCHETVPGYEEIPCFPEGSEGSPDADRFLQWYVTQEFQSGVFAHTDYDFTKPNAGLETKGVISREHAHAKMEVFDYPGYYAETGPGEDKAKIRIEELQAQHEISHGGGTVRGLGAGSLFALTEHPRADQNKSYLVVSSSFELSNPEYETGMGASGSEPSFSCHITAIDEQTQYRAPRLTPRPVVEGPQTATITGSGDDVWTDEYGRVKVKFHWDRDGADDETSSCWLRVSQNWAGQNWGGMFLPHIGQEVIVGFLEGDPDLPIVTGRVYNQNNMPPLDLPAAKVKSIIRDQYGNQMIFDATPGDEHIELYSPHHKSKLELGRSVRIASEQGFHWEAKGDSFETVSGTKAGIHIGAKVSGTIGVSADAMIGFKLGLHWGGKVDLFRGTSASYTWGNKMDFAKGHKVELAGASAIKHSNAEFIQRTMKDALIDAKGVVTLNAGNLDNSLMNLSTDAINIDFGEDNDGGDAGTDADQEAAAVEQAAAAMKAQAAAWAATFAGISAAASLAEGIWSQTSDAQGNDPDRDRWAALIGGGGVFGVGAVGLAGLALAWRAKAEGQTPEVISILNGVDSKNMQDKTYSRIRLVKGGVKIVTYDGTAPENDTLETDGQGFVLVKDTGDILIKSVKQGIKVEAAETKVEIVAKGAVEITGDGVVIDAGTGNLELKGSNVEVTGQSGYKVSAPQAKEN